MQQVQIDKKKVADTLRCMKTEGSLLYLQEPDTGPNRQRDESSATAYERV